MKEEKITKVPVEMTAQTPPGRKKRGTGNWGVQERKENSFMVRGRKIPERRRGSKRRKKKRRQDREEGGGKIR